MKKLITFLIGIFMPIILIGLGGVLAGYGLTNSWQIMIWAGLGLIGAGIFWGLVLFLWSSDGGF